MYCYHECQCYCRWFCLHCTERYYSGRLLQVLWLYLLLESAFVLLIACVWIATVWIVSATIATSKTANAWIATVQIIVTDRNAFDWITFILILQI